MLHRQSAAPIPQIYPLSVNNTDTSLADHIRLHPRVRLRTRNRLARKVGKEARRGAREGAGAAEPVDLANAAQVRLARLVDGGRRAGEVLALGVTVQDDGHVLEHGPFDEDVRPGVDLEGVARGRVVVPVVVDGVQEGVVGDLGGTAREVVDVVALHGDEVV